MKEHEGPTWADYQEIRIPGYSSCSACKYYLTRLAVSGRNPMYSHSCEHPEYKFPSGGVFGNLPNEDHTPQWCPFMKTTEPHL